MEPLRLEVARSADALERLRPAWESLPWQREEAAFDYFTARLRTRDDVIGPLAAIVWEGETVVAGLAGRLESRRLKTAVGYRVLYAPLVRYLRVVDGGFIAPPGPATDLLLGAIGDALRSGEADVAGFPPLEPGSELRAALAGLGVEQPFASTWTRRRLELPETFEHFVASRSSNTRWRIRRDARRLEKVFGPDLRVEVFWDTAGLEQLVRDADRIAGSTYQRALGAGFSDTPEQRELARVGLEHGWVRGYVLYLGETPVAYWLCSTYGGTILIRTTGFDEDYAEYRIGLYLLMRVIEDACADPDLQVLDFGPGDAAYKLQFSSGSRVERELTVFAPTARGRRIVAGRTLILAPARAARAVLDATDLTDRVRSSWRRRLRAQ